MQAELDRCISIAQRVLSSIGEPSYTPPPSSNAHAASILANIADVGIPRIEDSAVPAAIAQQLHCVAQEHFRHACNRLHDTHRHSDAAALQRLAVQIRDTVTSIYENKVLECAARAQKTSPHREKQPFANDVLLYAFERSQQPSRRERQVLASITGLTVEQVRVWFQNRRSRSKKKPTEMLSRPGPQLQDVLERVKASRNRVSIAKSTQKDEFEDDNDSGYCSGSDLQSFMSQLPSPFVVHEVVQLSTAAPTPRSYPAIYVPQQPSSLSSFDPPSWRRAAAKHPLACNSTVSVDELARSMARLTLRHRRTTGRASSSGACGTVSLPKGDIGVPGPTLAPASKCANVRKESTSRRKVAGGRRTASTASTMPSPFITAPDPLAIAVTHSAPTASDVPIRGRKKAGPPRRKPISKSSSRQPSDKSISVSSGSSNSSRSTSYASDFSFGSVNSDFSFTSVESAPTMLLCSQPQMASQDLSFDLNTFVPHPQPTQAQQQAQIPVYDLTSTTYGPATASTADFATLFGDAGTLQPLQMAQSQQQSFANPPQTPVLEHQSFDVGLANMDAFLDLSTSSFPNLQALLDGAGTDSSLIPLEHHFSWRDLSIILPSRA